MYDFSTARVRCSSIYNIMAGSDRKTNLQKWEEMCEELAKQQLREANMKKRDGPGYQKIVDTISRLENCLKVFESVKNDALPLSDGCKSFVSAWYGDIKYGKWNPVKDIGDKYTTKGKNAEESSIHLISVLDKEVYVKNELRISNDFLIGTPDIIVGESFNTQKIVDVKSPWECETFFSNLNTGLVPQYYYQMQGYMAITNSPIAEVNFCLVNIPDFMWNQERDRLFRKMEVVTELNADFVAAEKQLWKNLTFDDMPMEERRIRFVVERDDEVIQKIYRQVERCREYLYEVERMHILGQEALILDKISESAQLQESNS